MNWLIWLTIFLSDHLQRFYRFTSALLCLRTNVRSLFFMSGHIIDMLQMLKCTHFFVIDEIREMMFKYGGINMLQKLQVKKVEHSFLSALTPRHFFKVHVGAFGALELFRSPMFHLHFLVSPSSPTSYDYHYLEHLELS